MIPAQKNDQGFLSAEQQNHRFLNVLQLTYMSATLNKNGDYVIPQSSIEMIEKELDFNTSQTSEKKIIEEQKKKFRKRKSYLFWWEILNTGNYSSYDEAKDILLMIGKKTSVSHNSMTQEKYATETLFLALDDYFGTNHAIITPSRFLMRNVKVQKKNKGKKCASKKKSTKKPVTTQKSTNCAQPF
jgi:hypothetical protein